MFNKLLAKFRSHSEIFILILVVVIVAMLIIPLPTYVIDFLIALNFILAIMVFLASFYIDRILSFSTFPAVLLITTLFRLSLTISTSRLILNDADAGEIIETFGFFVIGNNLIVGFVIFAIITLFQFIVVTKGAERVAEVAARFSLDGMPGKQMSIDADLRAGVIDADEAKGKRSVLERESQLYGSFDGAMKFIKGDAIAGIIIIFINFIGGIGVGVSQHGMSFSEALHTYTILTVGDGLVGQIPSLLIAISSGFIVTRVNGDDYSTGKGIIVQMFGNPLVLAITALLALIIGLLPGFPLIIFVLLSLMLVVIIGYRKYGIRAPVFETGPADVTDFTLPTTKSLKAPQEESSYMDTKLGLISNINNVRAETIPLIILVPESRYESLVANQLALRIRSQFFIDYGINLPAIHLKQSQELQDNSAMLLINEIPVETFIIFYDSVLVVNPNDELMILNLDNQKDGDLVWVKQDDKQQLMQLGYQIRSALDELYYSLATVLAQNIHEFFGIQETKRMLDKIEENAPDLMKELLRNSTIQRITEVIQRLINERISVRNMKLIIETLAFWGPKEKDVLLLVEHTRAAMSRYISSKFSVNNKLRVVILSSQYEDVFRAGIRTTSGGVFLNIDPHKAEELIDIFINHIENIKLSHKDYVLLTSMDIRRFVKRFIETKYKFIDVLSFSEISENIALEVIDTI